MCQGIGTLQLAFSHARFVVWRWTRRAKANCQLLNAAFLVEIRTAQVEAAARTAQLAAVLFQLRGAIRTEAGSRQSWELWGFG
jgi:hypothetical protein